MRVISKFITLNREELIAFLSGDFLSSIITTAAVIDIDWIHPLIKLGFIAVGGLVGGFFGLMGKDVYNWLKSRFK